MHSVTKGIKRTLSMAMVTGVAGSAHCDGYQDSMLSEIEVVNACRVRNVAYADRYIRVEGGVYAHGTEVELMTNTTWNSERWLMEPHDGNFRFPAYGDPDYYLCARRANPTWQNGDSVMIKTWDETIALQQSWNVIPLVDGEVSFQLCDNTSFYMTASGSSVGDPVEVSSGGTSDTQKWKISLLETLQSPSIVRAPNGDLVAVSRKGSTMDGTSLQVYASTNEGQTWSVRCSLSQDIYGPSLFVNNGTLYMICSRTDAGSSKKLQLFKSTNNGSSWSEYTLKTLSYDIEAGGGSPVIEHNGYLYYGFMDKGGGGYWPAAYRLVVASCPVNSTLTSGSSWTTTTPLAFPSSPALSGTEGGWLEPNCVSGPDGKVWLVVRVDKEATGDAAAIAKVSSSRTSLEFTNQYPAPGYETGFIKAPWAGCGKFHILQDETSGRYLAMSNPYLGASSTSSRQPYVRNTLALYETRDLKEYTLVKTLIDEDIYEDWAISSWFTGFQQPAFVIDGDDLLYVSRTSYEAFEDYHDANRTSYHRLDDFRDYLTPDGEIAFYSFDSYYSPGADSSKMFNSDATVNGTSYVSGHFGTCRNFDGVNDYLGLMHEVSPKLHGSDVVTISVWIKNDTSSGMIFSSAIHQSSAGLGLELLNGELSMSGRSVSTDSFRRRNFSFSGTGTWRHVVAEWNFAADTMRLWLDKTELTGSGTVAFNNTSYTRGAPGYQDRIGSHFSGSSWFDGSIDEFHIYSRKLNDGEINELYSGTTTCALNGVYTIRINDPDYYLGVDAGSSWNDGDNVELQSWDGSASGDNEERMWSIVPLGNDEYHIRIHGQDACLRADPEDGWAEGNNVVVWGSNTWGSLKWKIIPDADGKFRINSVGASAYYLRADADSGWDYGNNVSIWNWHNWGSQKWWINQVDPSQN